MQQIAKAAAASTPWKVISRNVSAINLTKPFSEIPQPKWSLPFFGTALHYRLGFLSIEDRQKTLRDFMKNYGPIVKETIHGETVVHLFDPVDYQRVYAVEGKSPRIKPLLSSIENYRKERGYSPGVGNTNGEEWYRIRSAARHLMMQPVSVARFLGMEDEVTNDFVERLGVIKDGETHIVENLEMEIGKWNYETASRIVFDKRLGTLESGEDGISVEMININKRLFVKSLKLVFSFFPFHNYFKTPLWRQLVAEEDVFYQHVMKLFKEAVEDCREWMETSEEEDSDRYPFLRKLLSRDEITFLDCHSIAQSLFTDGMSTTVPSTISALYLLSAHPEKQEKLYEEVCDVVGATNRHVTINQLNRMPYLRASVKEALRLFPIGNEVSRITEQDLVLSGYHIPSGTAVELNNAIILKDDRYFSNPTDFIPERWLRGGESEIVHRYAHTPFSHGPRQCMGRRFAEQEMYVLLVKLVQNFRLQWCDSRSMGQTWRLLNSPNIPAKIAFYDRN